jgi:uncharacterized membrane protein
MIIPDTCSNDITHVIQLALAPAFLLTGVASILNVITGRLSRIIDRGRKLAEEPQQVNSLLYEIEYGNLEKRRHLASTAITASTFSALLVCLVIFVLFVKVILGLEINWVVSGLFAASTLSLLVGLTYFLREVHIATKTVRIPLPKK